MRETSSKSHPHEQNIQTGKARSLPKENSMTFILISGDPDTGKTHVCQELRDILDQDPSFAKPATPKQVPEA